MSVLQITKDNFEELVVKNDKVVLLDFWAPWCGPCRMVSPLVDQIGEEHTDFAVGKVNVDEEFDLAAQYRVVSIPTLMVLQNGAVADKMIGARGKRQILEMLD